ncbi:hypothetical protein P8452_61628 [Trifolium repens]|nr:hypothetical protein P8452_61628 [Trifolium repens]
MCYVFERLVRWWWCFGAVEVVLATLVVLLRFRCRRRWLWIFCVRGCFRRRFGVGSGVSVLRFGVVGVVEVVMAVFGFGVAGDDCWCCGEVVGGGDEVAVDVA